jgi:Protein of unknown function (DUF1674)
LLEFVQSSVYVAAISGKLSSGMTQPPPAPEQGEPPAAATVPIEIGGREGPEPTRFGDWELKGRCIDF